MNNPKTKNVVIISDSEENEKSLKDYLLKNNEEHNINFIAIIDFTEKISNVTEVADEIYLLVDGVAGVVPKTTTILKQLLEFNIKPTVVVNKIDNPEANIQKAVNEVIDVLVTAYASDEQLEFPVVYIK